MKKVALFFGSTTGTCEEIAYKIAKQLNLSKSDVYNVTDLGSAEDPWGLGINRRKSE